MDDWYNEEYSSPPPREGHKGYIVGDIIGALVTLVIMLIIIFVFLHPAFTSSNSTPTGSTSPLVGKWNLESIIVKGQQINDVDGSYIIFMSDGTGIEYEHSESLGIEETDNFHWEDLGNKVKLTYYYGDLTETVLMGYTIAGNTLTMVGTVSYQGNNTTMIENYIRA